MNIKIQLTNKIVIDNESDPYIIAEIGVNHEGSIEKAKELIDLAKQGGANAAKFQSYKANTLASRNSPSYWDTNKESTKSQYELFKKYDSFSEKEYILLAEYCKGKQIDFLSTPFDEESIEFLDPLVPFFKIASADITNLPFLRKVGQYGKPLVLSTGASNIEEINLALSTLKNTNCNQVALLHCILNYPTINKNAHLDMIRGLKRSYPNNIIGYSDHTLPDSMMTTLITANLLGAKIIEKHFTDDKTKPGNDHYHAMDAEDLKNYRRIISTINELRGNKIDKISIESEEISRRNARRSIVTKKDLKKGHEITELDIISKRPGTGISPIYWQKVIGMKIKEDLEEDHILNWSDLKDK